MLTDAAIALVHAIVALTLLGYAQNYYFHLRKCNVDIVERNSDVTDIVQATTRTMLIKWINDSLNDVAERKSHLV